MQIKTTVRYHIMSIRMAIIKKKNRKVIARVLGKSGEVGKRVHTFDYKMSKV